MTLFPVPRHEMLPPALTICLLPWFRIVYNNLWEKLVLPLEKKWEGTSQSQDSIVLQVGGAPAAEAPAHADNNVNRIQNAPEDMEEVWMATNLTTLCRKVVGAMLLPDACSLAGWLIGQIPWVKRKVPDRFSRNVIGGIVFLVLKVMS